MIINSSNSEYLYGADDGKQTRQIYQTTQIKNAPIKGAYFYYGAHDGALLEPLAKLLENVKTQQYQQIETNLNRLFA